MQGGAYTNCIHDKASYGSLVGVGRRFSCRMGTKWQLEASKPTMTVTNTNRARDSQPWLNMYMHLLVEYGTMSRVCSLSCKS